MFLMPWRRRPKHRRIRSEKVPSNKGPCRFSFRALPEIYSSLFRAHPKISVTLILGPGPALLGPATITRHRVATRQRMPRKSGGR